MEKRKGITLNCQLTKPRQFLILLPSTKNKNLLSFSLLNSYIGNRVKWKKEMLCLSPAHHGYHIGICAGGCTIG